MKENFQQFEIKMIHWYCISLSDLNYWGETLMRNGYQPETKQEEDAYLKIQTALIPNKSNVVQLRFCSMDWGTFMRNGYQPKTKQEEDAFLKKFK